MTTVSLEIHQTRRFAKRLAAMAMEGKNERIVAERAGKIIEQLQEHPLHEEAERKRTHSGELRLEDCRKYDLSCGFRLIALRRDNRLIFSWIGTHDECHRWLENNRNCMDIIDSEPIPTNDAGQCAPPLESDWMPLEADAYEAKLMAQIDEHLLRKVFPGHSGESRNPVFSRSCERAGHRFSPV